MNWGNLKQNKCPQCGHDLSDKLKGKVFVCTCGFTISDSKFREIVTKQVNKSNDSYFASMERERQEWQ